MPVAEHLLHTVEDYLNLPEAGPRYQLVEGQLIMAPAPNRFHQDISRNLEFILLMYLKQHPLGKVYDAPFDVYLDDINVFQPDLLFVTNEKLSIFSKRGAEGAPDLIVEILSPGTARLDRINKLKVYAAYGVPELWMIDPDAMRIEVYELPKDTRRPARMHVAGEEFECAFFPGLRIRVDEVFAA